MIRWLYPLFVCSAALAFLKCAVQAAPVQKAPPNFLIFLADGVGFSDAACYGGEISTPNLDQLAREGIRFTQAYNGGGGSPTRASLLTGYYPQHLQRDGVKDSVEIGSVAGKLPDWARLLPALLKTAGYRSCHSGRWGLSQTPGEAGFEHSYLHPELFAPSPDPSQTSEAHKPEAVGSRDGQSSAIADNAVGFLIQHASENPKSPFFVYVAFAASDFRVESSADDLLRYKGVFNAGTEFLREERLRRITESGLLRDPELSEMGESSQKWVDLPQAKREELIAQMGMHAAMVERMDREVGRVLDQVKEMGVAENTVAIFLSNGSSGAEIPIRRDGNKDTALEGVSRSALGNVWSHGASLSTTPLRGSNQFLHEGGISTPLIVRWPAGFKARGELRDQPVHVIDIAPTLLKIANVTWPKRVGDVSVPPADGVDFTSVLRENKPLPNRALWWSWGGHRAFRLGDWKWISLKGESPELYYIKADRAEMRDLAGANAERLQEMEAQWTKMERKFSIEDAARKNISDSK